MGEGSFPKALRSRGRELGLHEVAGLSHQTHCDEDAERTAGTEGEGGPRVAGGSQVRGHRRTPASRAPPALPNSSVRASLHLQGAQQAQTGLRDTTEGRLCRSLARLGPLSQGKSGEEVDRGGAEFQSPRNLASGNLESEQETHPCKMSLRHKGEKEGVGHTARTHPCTLHSELLQRTRGWGKNTHMPLFIYNYIFNLITNSYNCIFMENYIISNILIVLILFITFHICQIV